MKDNQLLIRMAARGIDYISLSLLGAVASLFLPFEYDLSSFNLFVPLLFIPIEALCLSLFGTTLGKALFSLSVRGEKGVRLSFGQALKRALFFKKRPGFLVQGKKRFKKIVVATLLAATSMTVHYQNKPFDEYFVRFEESGKPRGWIDYESKEGGFQILFPTKPEVKQSEFEITDGKQLQLNEHKSVHKDGKVSYAVSFMDLPKKWTMFSSKTLLKGAMKVIASHEKEFELISQQITTHKGYPALDYELRQGEKKMEGRLVLVGATIYRLAVVYPQENLPQEEHHDSFVNSFELKK